MRRPAPLTKLLAKWGPALLLTFLFPWNASSASAQVVCANTWPGTTCSPNNPLDGRICHGLGISSCLMPDGSFGSFCCTPPPPTPTLRPTPTTTPPPNSCTLVPGQICLPPNISCVAEGGTLVSDWCPSNLPCCSFNPPPGSTPPPGGPGIPPGGSYSPGSSRDPRSEGFTPLEYYPCTDTADPEFHPQRPYPASPCRPLIPDSTRISFSCGKSLDVQGTFEFPATADVTALAAFEPNTAIPGTLYRCDPLCQVTPTNPTCEICAIKRVGFDISLDLTNAKIPIVGNTQDPLDDATKVNNFLNWYFNGTIQHAEQIPLAPTNPGDIDRLINYSGPLKKLLPQDIQKNIKDILNNLNNSGAIGSLYHDYFVIDGKRLGNSTLTWSEIFKYVPLSSLEDTTGEFTVGLIPEQQPGNPADLGPDAFGLDYFKRGQVIPDTTGRNAIFLTIKPEAGDQTDSRLYFPHVRSLDVLSKLLASTFRPGGIFNSKDLNSIVNNLPDDTNPPQYPQYDYLTGRTDTRNTQVIPGQPAPPPLINYGGYDQLCDLSEVRVNPGDSLVGSTVTARLGYTQIFRYSPQTSSGSCIADARSCDPSLPDSQCCDPAPAHCGDVYDHGSPNPRPPPLYLCHGNPPQDTNLPTEARVGVFVKSPLLDRIYDTLVIGTQSIMHRFFPGRKTDPGCPSTSFPYCNTPPGNGSCIPATNNQCTNLTGLTGTVCCQAWNDSITGGRDIPGAADAVYSGTGVGFTAPETGQTYEPPQSDTAVTSGKHSSLAQIYFKHLGSILDHFLGAGTENNNLQKLLRPQGFSSGSIGSIPPISNASLQQIAAQYHVPAEFLDAIWYVESGRAPSGSNCASCATGACGPMQIGIGAYNNVTDPSENLNRCNLPDAFIIAARVLLDKKYCTIQTASTCTTLHANPATAYLTIGSISSNEYYPVARYNGSDGCWGNNETKIRWDNCTNSTDASTCYSYCDAVHCVITNPSSPPLPQPPSFTITNPQCSKQTYTPPGILQ